MFLNCLFLVLVLSFVLGTWGIDNTLVPGTKGEDVVCEVIKKIDNSGIFPGDEKMLRRIAYVESKFGEDRGTYRKGYHGGIWQVDKMAFDDVIINGSHANLDKLWSKIVKLLPKQKKDIKWEDLRTPIFSGVFARIKLYSVGASLPGPNDLDEQALYWKSHYNSELGKGTVDDFVKRVNDMNEKFGSDCNMCQGRMNLAIVMDGSGSIGSGNYRYAKQTAEKLIDTFSNEMVDIGYVLFSNDVEVVFPFKSNLTRDQMKKKIDDSLYPESGTRTDLAIDEGVTILGKAHNHTGVPKVIAIFTDGQPDNALLAISSAERAKKSNITIFAIAIGSGIDENTLKQMASQESFVIPVTSYKDLIQFTDRINSRTCRVPQTPDIGSKVENDQLGKKEKRYFKFQLPTKGITIKIDVRKGKTQGYYSYTNENPSSAINDGLFTKDVFIAPHKSYNGRVKRDINYTGSVYVTMQGQEDNNMYSLETIEGNKTNGGDQLKTSMLRIICFTLILIIKFV